MDDKNNSFGEEYFDLGEKKSGQYALYNEQRFYPAFKAMARRLIELVNPEKALDLGCAKGYLVDTFHKFTIDAKGTDISEYAINASPAAIRSHLEVVDLNTQSLPFADASFDVVVCMGTLEYLQNQKNALLEIKRVLKPKGFILITTLNYVAQDDALRVYARKEQEWDDAFKALGFSQDHRLAKSIFSAYVRKIVIFDLKQTLFRNDSKKSLKKRIGGFLYNFIPDAMLAEYLLYAQIKSGYTMLGYQKQA